MSWSDDDASAHDDITIAPAQPRLTLSMGPEPYHQFQVVALDPTTCRVDVLQVTENRFGAEGYEDNDRTERFSFTAGEGTRQVTGESRHQVFDPQSDETVPIKATARRITPP